MELITPTDLNSVTAASNFFFVRVNEAKKYGLSDGQVCDDNPNSREFTIFILRGNYATPNQLVRSGSAAERKIKAGERCSWRRIRE